MITGSGLVAEQGCMCRSFLTVGKGNADSWNSCSHGAGRAMSGTRAKAVIKQACQSCLSHCVSSTCPMLAHGMPAAERQPAAASCWYLTQAAMLQADFEASMASVVCDMDHRVRDEAPAAYKAITKVMAAQTELLDIKARLLPLINVKGF